MNTVKEIKVMFFLTILFLFSMTAFSTTKVLIIGSGKFFDKTIIELEGAITDAKTFKEAIVSLGIASLENITYVENPPNGILTASIYEFFINCEPQDRLILYYSGHGYTENGKTYLIPYDVRSNLISKTAYNLTDELPELLAKTKAQEIVIIMDACYSGSIIKDRPLANVRIDKTTLEDIAKQTNVVFLLSSAPNEVSQEKPTGGGWFTHYLIEGLKGEAGKDKEFITTTDLYNYVRNAVSKQTFNKQNPQLIGSKPIVLTVNQKEVYKKLITEISILGIEGKIPKEYVPMYTKILLQEESKDNELEKKIRSYLLAYGKDKNLNALLAQTKLALIEGTTTPDYDKPGTSPTTGTCLLKIYAGNELAKSAKVFIDNIEAGNLSSGILEALDLVLGKHLVIIDGDKIEKYEKEITFTYQYEVQEIKFIATPATRPVRIQTEPTLAKVYIDGKEVGTSTWQGTLEVGRTYEITVKKEGYRTETRKINIPIKGELIPINMKLSINNPPEQPKIISPVDGAKDLPTEVILKWESKDPDGDEVTYDLYFGTEPNNLKLMVKDLRNNEYKISELVHNTVYYLKIVAKDQHGATTETSLLRLVTKKPEYYVNLKGQLMVTDKIQGLIKVDNSKIPNPLYRDDNVAIWKTQPNSRTLAQHWHEAYRHLVPNTIPKDLLFYAKLEGDQLSVMIVSSEEASLRGMLGFYDDNDKYTITSPKSGKTDMITGTFGCTYSGIHQSRKYDKTRTLIYQVLIDTLEQLIAWGVVNKDVKMNRNPTYFCSFADKIFVVHYYVTCCEYAYGWNAYHNWPYGDGQDEVHYAPGWFVTEYDDGEAIKKLEFSVVNPKRYFLVSYIANDNGERTKLSLDGNTLLEQINWGVQSTFRLGSVSPKVVEWYGKKTWSLVSGLIWMAIVADDVKVNVFSQIPGKNPVPEQLDIFEVYKVTKRDIVW